ncbi:MAG: potassium transporter TrkG [Eubacteriales bacterium]|nr:potassium transporter TrkG [Eubacteriales bacterium]
MKFDTGKKLLSTTQIIILAFFGAILVGTLLLMLPCSAASKTVTPFLDALFTATTSVCVTGLVTVTTATHWSLFGKILILLLIQIGGLGVITMTTLIFMMLRRRISLGYRKLLEDSFNLDTLSGIVAFLKKVVLGTLIVEGIGAICCLPVFAKDYGLGKGMWISVFHAISAFCNAGIDIIGDSSLMPYVHHVWMNLVTSALIILGGIGFIVWWDVAGLVRRRLGGACGNKGTVRKISLHSKVILVVTASLLAVGTLGYFIFEYHNSATIGEFGFGEKILACFFQSVTTRTAGFAAISQKGLTPPSVLLTCLLMLIGGSSTGTAGGVKTGTIAVLILAVAATVRGQEDVTVFRRRIPLNVVRKSFAVVSVSIGFSILAFFLLFLFTGGSAQDILFEVYSALGTAGLSRDFTASLSTVGKLIICVCMFLGRVGPMSMVLAFTMRNTPESTRYVEEEITVG